MKSILAEEVPLVLTSEEVQRKVWWLQIGEAKVAPDFPKGRPRSWEYCEHGCIHQFSGERICHQCSNWELFPTG